MIKLIVGMMAAIAAKGSSMTADDHKEIAVLSYQRNAMLLNGRGPIPSKIPNQRQRRKQWRQVPQSKH